ncbi:hypothetical protein [Mycobacterium sp.]|uniref:hypothetical protein n=1 Tax=Mycobacterium sp. TaxID=1785 RepID=UPI0025E5694B|nr:hypothetical protein [Mycobacterium sp.]
MVALLSTGTSYVSTRSSERQAREALTYNDRRADEEFRRTNQRVAYAEFQIEMVRANNGIARFGTILAFETDSLLPVESIKRSMQSLLDAMTPMNDKFAVVQMVASERTLQSATEWLVKTSNTIGLLSSSLTYAAETYSADQAKLRAIAEDTKEMSRLRMTFLKDARSDVNAFG